MKILISVDGCFRLSIQVLKRLILAGQAMTIDHDNDFLLFGNFEVDVGDGFKRGFMYNGLAYNDVIHIFDDDQRSNPFLIALVEELGEAANGKHCSLKIVEVPDGIEWYRFEDEDGTESIHEKHRSWN